MAKYPIPHTEEWFAALERFNPHQAAMTRQILELAGRADVCSVCGDAPATDFEVVRDGLPRDAVASIRLCADCLAIRTRNIGERLAPLNSTTQTDFESN
jgi:hypothetical protein